MAQQTDISALAEDLMAKGIARTKLDAEKLAENILKSQNHTNVNKVAKELEEIHRQKYAHLNTASNSASTVSQNYYQHNSSQSSNQPQNTYSQNYQNSQFQHGQNSQSISTVPSDVHNRLEQLENTISILKAELREAKTEIASSTNSIHSVHNSLNAMHDAHANIHSKLDTLADIVQTHQSLHEHVLANGVGGTKSYLNGTQTADVLTQHNSAEQNLPIQDLNYTNSSLLRSATEHISPQTHKSESNNVPSAHDLVHAKHDELVESLPQDDFIDLSSMSISELETTPTLPSLTTIPSNHPAHDYGDHLHSVQAPTPTPKPTFHESLEVVQMPQSAQQIVDSADIISDEPQEVLQTMFQQPVHIEEIYAEEEKDFAPSVKHNVLEEVTEVVDEEDKKYKKRINFLEDYDLKDILDPNNR
jgi:hypothetical protein